MRTKCAICQEDLGFSESNPCAICQMDLLSFADLYKILSKYKDFFIISRKPEKIYDCIAFDDEMELEFSFNNLNLDDEDFQFSKDEQLEDLKITEKALTFSLKGVTFYLQVRTIPSLKG